MSIYKSNQAFPALSGSLLSIGCALMVVALSWGALTFKLFSLSLRIPRTALLLSGVFCVAWAMLAARRSGRSLQLSPILFALSLPLVIFSTYSQNSQNFFQSSYPVLVFVGLFLVTLLFFKQQRWLWHIILFLSVAAGFVGLIFESQGRLLFGDDHSAFLYRLGQLKAEFPLIPFYNPDWNGGVEAREFFPSGVLNVFFLCLPLLYLFEATTVYNWLVAGVLFVLVPISSIGAARIARLESPTPIIAGILSIGASWLWYRWGLSYGTLGFITSVALVPLNLALIARIVENPKQLPTELILLFAVAFSLTLFWPLGAIILAPAIIVLASRLGTILSDRRYVICFLLLAFIHIPWMTIFVEASQVASFVGIFETAGEATSSHIAPQMQREATDISTILHPKQLLKEIRKNINSVNPALLLLFLPGIALLKFRAFKLLLIVNALWILLLALIAAPFKPQLELFRFYLVLWLLLAQPAAFAITLLSKNDLRNKWQKASRVAYSLAAAILLFIPWQLYLITSKKTVVQFHFADDLLPAISQAINLHGGDGRVLFAGFILHELSNGHVAPLPLFTDQPLIASSYQHSHWQYTDVIPDYFRSRKESGVEEFLDLYNVSSVITHDRFWRKWFSKRTERYRPVWRHGSFTLFERINFNNSYFLSGEGSVLDQANNSSRITLIPRTASAVIKFNYFNFLEAQGCDISAHPAPGDLNLIRLDNCNIGQKVVIQSVTPLRRFLSIIW